MNGLPAEKALHLLRMAYPDVTPGALARLTVGQRDLCLIKLREQTFGTHLTGVADCPGCSERVELDFDSRDIVDNGAVLPELQEETSSHSYQLDLPGWELSFRLPTNEDMLGLPRDNSLPQKYLLKTCLIEARHDGEDVLTDDLPAEVVTAIAEKMVKEDPYLNITLALKCPACGHEWKMIFDIVSYFMSEINTWAARLLRQVHRLATAYGWRETDILSMSAWRRQHYLELIAGS